MKVAITVKPGSKKGPLVQVEESGELIVYVREQAVDGKANTAAMNLLAKHFGVPKTRITILRGHTSHKKLVEIHT